MRKIWTDEEVEVLQKHYATADTDLLCYALGVDYHQLCNKAAKLELSRQFKNTNSIESKARDLIDNLLRFKQVLRDSDECAYLEDTMMIVPLDKIERTMQNLFNSVAEMLEQVNYPTDEIQKSVNTIIHLIKPLMKIENIVDAFINNNNLTELKSTFRHVLLHWALENPDEAKAGLGDDMNAIGDFLDAITEASRVDLRKKQDIH